MKNFRTTTKQATQGQRVHLSDESTTYYFTSSILQNFFTDTVKYYVNKVLINLSITFPLFVKYLNSTVHILSRKQFEFHSFHEAFLHRTFGRFSNFLSVIEKILRVFQ